MTNDETLTLAVDAESGKRGRGAWMAAVAAGSLATEPERTVYFTVAGHEKRLTERLETFGHNPERIRIRDTSSTTTPSSLEAVCRTVAGGEADAAVTARPTREASNVAREHFQRLEPVQRAAATATFAQPGDAGGPHRGLLLDAGATDEASTDDLVQFAEMGAIYTEMLGRRTAPKVALLSNGDTVGAAPPRIARAADLLAEDETVAFGGVVPSDALMRPDLDVLATDGFVGRVVLDLLEKITELAADLTEADRKQRSIWHAGLAFLSGDGTEEADPTAASPDASPILGLDETLVLAAPDARRAELIDAFGVAADCVALDLPARLERRLA